MKYRRLFLVLAIILLVGWFFVFDIRGFLNLEYFQQQREILLAWTEAHFFRSALLFFLLYILVTALSLPAASFLTLVAGALFGFGWGLLIVSFASSIGATLALLASRILLQEWVQTRFRGAIGPINRGVERDGAFYLLTLRLLPLFPFFMVNLVMGVTRIRVATFYIVSQIGMLAGTALYVNVGAQLGQATSIPEVLSIEVLVSFVALAVFPWLARAFITRIRAGRVYRGFRRPSRYDANMVVIGAGAAGLVTSLIGSLVKSKTILIEKHRMGGDCLNTGCVPSKALLRSAAVSHLLDRAGEFGIEGLDPGQKKVNFARVMERVREVIRTIEPHDSVERYESLGVECITGEARVTSPFSVAVNGREITTRNIIIATGARPQVPAIPGLETIGYHTSETIWNLTELPARLLVLGGGPIGCELAQAFSRLGSKVIQADMASHLLPREDEEASVLLEARFAAEGIDVRTGHKVLRFEMRQGERVLVAEHGGTEVTLAFDEVLLATGRTANTEGFGLEELGITKTANGTLEVNEYLQTRFPNIYACGDVTGPYQFTHMASHQAWYAAVNSLFGGLRKYMVNYSVVPWVTFTDPEVARVGLSEAEAVERGIRYEVTCYHLDDLDRAIADSEAGGVVKVLTVQGSDRILGALIVGHHAGDLLSEFVLAMTHNLGLKEIMATIHVYPTMAEGSKFAAGEWRKKHAPEWVYPWLEKFHAWRRR